MDQTFRERVDHFLSQHHIAVAGYSTDRNQVANHLYNKFMENGFEVYAVNPKADMIEDVSCYKKLSDIPSKVDAVMISTPPDATLEIVRECIAMGIKHVWIHSSIGKGSYNREAVALAEKNGLEIIPRACPMMFLKPDGFHACFKWFMQIGGKLRAGN